MVQGKLLKPAKVKTYFRAEELPENREQSSSIFGGKSNRKTRA
jgi:hypothetical protein